MGIVWKGRLKLKGIMTYGEGSRNSKAPIDVVVFCMFSVRDFNCSGIYEEGKHHSCMSRIQPSRGCHSDSSNIPLGD